MLKRNISSVFYHYYHLAYSDRNFSSIEKTILENYAFDIGVCLNKIENDLLSFDSLKEVRFIDHLEFLYGLYVSICKHKMVNENTENILKRYCLKVGFYNSNIDELSITLLENAKKGIEFEVLLDSLKI